jgi:hypothetical protein
MQKLFDDNQLYPSKEVIKKSNIGLSTLLKLEATGVLKTIRISERIKRYSGETLNALFSEQS